MFIKKTKKRIISPIIAMIIFILAFSVLSLILSILNVSANQISIVNGSLETSIVLVRNIFSKEGMINFFTNVVTNYSLIEPIALLIISFMAVSIGKSSGLLKHLFSPLRKFKSSFITFIVIFLGVISSIIGEYSYVILIPLVAILYEYLNKNPIYGIVTVFLGITLGYGTGLFVNYNDYALGILTQTSAIIDVDATYKFSVFSNQYIMIASTIAITCLMTMLVNKYLADKLLYAEEFNDELNISKKSLLLSGLVGIILLFAVILFILPNGILLDNTQTSYIAKLFSPTSPFNLSFMFIVLFIFSAMSIVYGITSKNFKDEHQIGWGYTKSFNNVGYLFILLFLSSILTNIVSWTNMGTVIGIKILDLISLFDLTGIPLIIVSFICILLMSIFIPNSLEKWYLISPVLVPIFMRGNLTPDFAQFVFKAAESVGKVITPLFIYFIVMVGFIQKYNTKQKPITLFDTIKLVWPIIIAMIIFWLLILVIWYVAGLPLGIGTSAIM